MRKKFTLSIDGDLIRRIKIRAIEEGRDVSDIVEELLSQYLESGKKRA